MIRRRSLKSSLLSLSTVLACAALYAPPALAQNTTGFAVNRFNPSERGSDWFWAESLDLRGHNRWAVGVVGDWAYKPLVAYDANGDEEAALIQNQIYAHLGASVVFWDRLRLGASLPILAYQNGDSIELAGGRTLQAPTSAALGDLRLGADVRILGEYGGAFTLAAGMQVHLPTGSQKNYTSDGSTRLAPRIAAAGDIGIFTYAVKTGINVRFQGESFADAAFGNEWTFGGAAGLRLLDKKLTIGPEVWGSTVIEDGSAGFFSETGTPLEGILGAHYKLDNGLRFGGGVGPGFTQGLGSPELRTLLSVEWLPEPKQEKKSPTPDTDGDGIYDKDDACPTEQGPSNRDASKNGCPLPEDTDGDGILDIDDACPLKPGKASDNPTLHGCPIPDTDRDGILDPDDACVDEAGVSSPEPEKNGCPLPKDTDGDGIFDEQDACPEKAGPPSDDPQRNGCPKAQVVGNQVKILERIEFDSGKAELRESSSSVLEAVLTVLTEHPEIEKMRIEGHTDNRGGAWLNKNLSEKRALAVRKWLIDKGIEESRLTAVGIGQDKPIETNDTDEGRQNNRRVEFHILKTNDQAAQ